MRPDSKTETYFALKTEFSIRAGRAYRSIWRPANAWAKRAKRSSSRSNIRRVCLLCEAGHHGPNRIAFRLEPNDEIIVDFWTRKPGFENVLEERMMSFFLYEKKNKVQYVEEYAKVLHAAIFGEQSFFVSSEEVEALWKFVDPIVDAWRRDLVPLHTYAPDTTPHPDLLDETPDMHETSKGPVGFIGLGKMGGNLVRQLIDKNWNVIGFNRSPGATKELERDGMTGAFFLAELVKSFPRRAHSG